MSDNPLLQPFNTPFDVIPFDRIKGDHYLPAIKQLIPQAKEKIAQITSSPAAPTFQNTLVALDEATEQVNLASEVFFNLLSAEAGEEMHALAKEISPLLAEFSNDILLDPKIFEKVKAAYESRATQNLSAEETRILEKSYKDFVRNGALLSGKDKDRLREIDVEMSKLGPQFSENVLKATNAFELHLTEKAQVEGLPESALEAATLAAKQRGKNGGWVFTLDAPSLIPVLTYAKDRSLREKLSKAYGSRAYGDAFDNRENAKRIAVLRFERAKLLGFKNHADYVLKERMAEDPVRVTSFLERILKVARPVAEKEINEMKLLRKELDGADDFQPWDSAYYSEKLKHKKFDFDEEELRPYFKLENVIDGVFEHARRLYNLEFKTLGNVPVYHPDVKVYEVSDSETKKFIGLMYADFFPRPTKKGGAWMTAYREQGLFAGQVRRPHVGIVCNFTKPTESKPSLLSFDEVRTLFHEFGHALHGLLSDCTYRSLAGTNVYWDFVELPSQIMENWVTEKESLDLFARHFESGESIPEDYTRKIKESSTFQSALMALRQVGFSLLDLAWHASDPSSVASVDELEDQVLARTRVLPKVAGTATSTSFSHIFAGGYSAGYYSYKWAEVLDADAFELFKEKGLFNQEVSLKFRDHILSRGGTEPPMDLYKKFRGREPDPDALLRREALLV